MPNCAIWGVRLLPGGYPLPCEVLVATRGSRTCERPPPESQLGVCSVHRALETTMAMSLRATAAYGPRRVMCLGSSPAR